ncbi:DUF6221 family protein [Streptomyces sp. NPDC005953]|uniref:DUF6221 family protein n=1 Tax=Streptomyces sp. NPDC005953 TaxID=3156719 RepID=UPI0033D72826
MNDLVTFLKARIDRDEETAHAATSGPWTTMGQRVLDPSPPSDRLGIGMAVGHAAASADYNETAAHIARHDPTRVLREAEAKRRLITIHRRYTDEPGQACLGCAGGIEWESCPVLPLLALPYADHPDYRPEWRP